MRRAFILFLLLTTLSFAKDKKKPEPIQHRVGLTYRQFQAPEDYNWRGSGAHVLQVAIWYPADPTADEKEQQIGDPPMFIAGRAAKDATMAVSFNPFPMVVLSHGTGGSALQMAWLGTYLASRGYIAVAVNHPGNNAVTGYTPEGFTEWWLRARDLSVVIDSMLADKRFGPRIDRDRIGAAGFSLGGYTMMEIAGGNTNFHAVAEWCKEADHAKYCNIPEMPDLMQKVAAMKTQPEFQAALDHAGDSYRDPRVRAVFAIAPALGKAFSPESLNNITIPVDIVVGASDPIAPAPDNAQYYADHIKGAKLTILPGGVAHYTFLDVPTDFGKKQAPEFFSDAPGVDREAIHQQVAEMAADFFDKELTPVKHKKK